MGVIFHKKCLCFCEISLKAVKCISNGNMSVYFIGKKTFSYILNKYTGYIIQTIMQISLTGFYKQLFLRLKKCDYKLQINKWITKCSYQNNSYSYIEKVHYAIPCKYLFYFLSILSLWVKDIGEVYILS